MEVHSSRERALLAYVADLELEVDRLRKQADLLQVASADAIKQIQTLFDASSYRDEESIKIQHTLKEYASLLNDVKLPRRSHPLRDEVAIFAVRPMVDQVIRWQQRALDIASSDVDVQSTEDYLEWFPGRFRHILENLIANALTSYDSLAERRRVKIVVRSLQDCYELEVSDHGKIVMNSGRSVSLELYHRASPERSATVGVGLAVVETLVDACGGKCKIATKDGFENVVTVQLPRFDASDYLNESK